MAINPYCERLEAALAHDLKEEATRTQALVGIADALQRIAAVLEAPATKERGTVPKHALKLLGTRLRS